MVRCEEFYKKYEREGNFCGKHPDTAARILKYIDLMNEINDEVTKSKILSNILAPIGRIITEGASRPVLSIKNPDNRQKAIEQIVKRVEEKWIDGQNPQVTAKEVAEIVRKIAPSKKTSKAPKSKFEVAKEKLNAAFDLENIAQTPEAINSAITEIDEIIKRSQEIKKSLTDRRAVIELAVSHEAEQKSPQDVGNVTNQMPAQKAEIA